MNKVKTTFYLKKNIFHISEVVLQYFLLVVIDNCISFQSDVTHKTWLKRDDVVGWVEIVWSLPNLLLWQNQFTKCYP